MKLVDLHTHTQASDGTTSPGDLVRQAQECGLAAVAVTDHDTVSGLAEAQAAGKEYGVEVVRGCELSTSTDMGEMHILGLWLPDDVSLLQGKLKYLRRKRGERNGRIVEKLQGLGIDISMDEVLEEARGECVGRPHIAAVLMRKGVVKDIGTAFKEYLGYYGKAYLPKEVLQPEDAVRLLCELGATVSWAHPMLSTTNAEWREAFLRRLVDNGLSAIEAYHSEHSAADIRACVDMARRYGLALSGGSDYHGANKPKIRLGVGYGSLRVPYDVFETLRTRRARQGLSV